MGHKKCSEKNTAGVPETKKPPNKIHFLGVFYSSSIYFYLLMDGEEMQLKIYSFHIFLSDLCLVIKDVNIAS